MKNIEYIAVELSDKSRPKERPPKTNWKIELIKKAMKALQYASPRKVAEVVWHYFTMPGKVNFSDPQLNIIQQAEIGSMMYRDTKLVTYKWGSDGPKVLLTHGWRSKAADFRKLILAYLESGYQVYAFDARAHGNSGGKHTALPEFRDSVKLMTEEFGRFEIMVGYSIGGLATGIAISELEEDVKPDKYFMISGPAYVRYFFKDVVKEVGLSKAVYQRMAEMVEKVYGESIDNLDLRTKADKLLGVEKFFIYCEDDEVVPFKIGMELFEHYPNARFVQARGFGHYKIISHPLITGYVIDHSKTEVKELATA